MEQRPLRLGDIVDDYCPRERRITNHAIVAIVNEEVRQTRCATCEAEHVYKAAKVPRRRRPDAADEALPENAGQLVPPREAEPEPPAPAGEPVAEVALQADSARADENGTADAPEEPRSETQADNELWHTHRRLIRATLPRTEGDPPPPRPIPEFTMHQRPGRGPHGRGGHWQGNGNGNATGDGHGRPRHGRGMQGHNQGNGQGGPGHGHGRPGRSGRHRHKRSR
jgi:hypothetical protein